MTTWHNRLEEALAEKDKSWQDLFDYMSKEPAKLKKPSVYAWKPGANKRSTMMDADNAALVCNWLGVSPMWLFHGDAKAQVLSGQDKELLDEFHKLDAVQRSILLVGLKAGASKRHANDHLIPTLIERGRDRRHS